MADPTAELSPLEIEAWIVSWLNESKEIYDALGAAQLGGGKVFRLFVPTSEALPAITYRRRSTSRGKTTRGADGLATAIFELRVCNKSDDTAGTELAVARYIRDKVNGHQGRQGNHAVRECWLEDEYDEDEGTAFDDGVVALARVLVLKVTYRETTRQLIGGG